MSEHDELYGQARQAQLLALLRHLAGRIRELDQAGRLLQASAELQRLLGDARSELFHYEVRCTYDSPEVADSRRIVDEARREFQTPEPPEDDEPWRRPAAD